MASMAGVSVASIYYNQPLLEAIRVDFQTTAPAVGWIPTFTQLGYAVGMLLFIPMGDLFERVKLMQVFNLLAALSLLAICAAPNLAAVLAGSFAVGLTSMIPQILLPYTAHHVPEKERGRALGLVLSGLLLGILLARTVSGFLGAALGWRGMFLVAGIALLPMTYFLGRRLPRSRAGYKGSYKSLLFSLGGLTIKYAELREAALIGGCLFGAFSAFWSTLIFLISGEPYHWGMRAAGLFGLLGAAGAMGAPIAGKFSDRANPRLVVGLGLGLSLIAFGLMALNPGSIFLLVFSVLILDLGVQASHVANQNRIFALEAIGGAFGSSGAAWAWHHSGWRGVCGLAAALLICGILQLLFSARRASMKSLRVGAPSEP